MINESKLETLAIFLYNYLRRLGDVCECVSVCVPAIVMLYICKRSAIFSIAIYYVHLGACAIRDYRIEFKIHRLIVSDLPSHSGYLFCY